MLQPSMVLEFDGKEYEIRYTFKSIRAMRQAGINVLAIYRSVVSGVGDANLFDYGDEVAEAVAWLLRDAGADKATGEEVWKQTLSSGEGMANLWGAFMFIMNAHMGASESAPRGEAKEVKNN